MRRYGDAMYELWSAIQACVWFTSRDEVAVFSLPYNYTFAMLAFYVEMELNDSDDADHTIVVRKGMTVRGYLKRRDRMVKKFGPQKADTPGTAWIEGAQKELLAACARGALKMTGRPLSGGASRAIPAEAFATFRFFENDGVDCLGPPDLVDADCWRDLRLQAEDVRRIWPASAERKLSGAERDRLFNRFIEQNPDTTQDHAEEELRKVGLTREDVRGRWKSHPLASRRAPGRPRK
jgi:hypothetical protein